MGRRDGEGCAGNRARDNWVGRGSSRQGAVESAGAAVWRARGEGEEEE